MPQRPRHAEQPPRTERREATTRDGVHRWTSCAWFARLRPRNHGRRNVVGPASPRRGQHRHHRNKTFSRGRAFTCSVTAALMVRAPTASRSGVHLPPSEARWPAVASRGAQTLSHSGPSRDTRLVRLPAVSVESPEFRRDLLTGLDTLAGEPAEGFGVEGTLLERAVHAVVDDTGWDLPGADPEESIGTILVNQAEADAVRPVIAAVCRVSDRQGPTAPDAAWFADEEWPLVRRLAAVAGLDAASQRPLAHFQVDDSADVPLSGPFRDTRVAAGGLVHRPGPLPEDDVERDLGRSAPRTCLPSPASSRRCASRSATRAPRSASA